MAPARTSASASLVVEFGCRVCGRPIRMVAEHVATELADRAAFLRDHRQCLAANIPRQRSDDA